MSEGVPGKKRPSPLPQQRPGSSKAKENLFDEQYSSVSVGNLSQSTVGIGNIDLLFNLEHFNTLLMSSSVSLGIMQLMSKPEFLDLLSAKIREKNLKNERIDMWSNVSPGDRCSPTRFAHVWSVSCVALVRGPCLCPHASVCVSMFYYSSR